MFPVIPPFMSSDSRVRLGLLFIYSLVHHCFSAEESLGGCNELTAMKSPACREIWLKLNLLTVSCEIYIETLQSVCGLIWWLLSQRRGFGCRVINGTNITSLTRVCTSLPIRNVKISRNLSRPEISPRSVRYTRHTYLYISIHIYNILCHVR
jgi:hypothetical protein